MLQNKFTNFSTITLLLLICMQSFILSCEDLNDEETTDRIRFAEFFFFPTAPYINKSYLEEVPSDEIASLDIDYETEIAEIQTVYKTFIESYVAKDMDKLSETLDFASSMEFGTTTGIVYGWLNIRDYIRANWYGPWGSNCISEPDWELTDFYYRPKYVKYNYPEVSAKGPMFYYLPGKPVCFNDIGTYYFTKRSGEWRIHQIDGSRYFVNLEYKVPKQ